MAETSGQMVTVGCQNVANGWVVEGRLQSSVQEECRSIVRIAPSAAEAKVEMQKIWKDLTD